MKTQKKPGGKFKVKYLVPPLIGLTGIISMILISEMLSHDHLPILGITAYNQLNFLLTMQLFILPVSFLVLGAMYLYERVNFRLFFRAGDVFANAHPVKLLGFRNTSTWKKVGPVITLIATIVTMVFTTITIIQMRGVVNTRVLTLFPFALLLALTNSWSENIFGRFSVVAGLYGRVKPNYIYWTSAVIFGIPHYFGTPGGLLGILLTGILSWLLAKSMYETKGLFWSWFIHFILDMLIFTANIMILVGSI